MVRPQNKKLFEGSEWNEVIRQQKWQRVKKPRNHRNQIWPLLTPQYPYHQNFEDMLAT